MDLERFAAWLLTRHKGGLAVETVRKTQDQARFMAANGWSWERFAAGPEEAFEEAERFLAWVAGRERRHAQRNYAKTINRAARFLATQDQRFASWRLELPRSASSARRVATDAQMQALLAYEHRKPVVQARRRAIVWFAWATSWRRGEIARLKVQDLDAMRGVVQARPGKNGVQGFVPLPWAAWDPEGPVQQWLKVRPPHADGWFWTTRPEARRGSATLFNSDLVAMAHDLGFHVTFQMIRHWGGELVRRNGGDITTGQGRLRHNNPGVTQRYFGHVSGEELAARYEAIGMPGFKGWAEERARRDALQGGAK